LRYGRKVTIYHSSYYQKNSVLYFSIAYHRYIY